MKRIIYVPWPESDCPNTATNVKSWRDSYRARTYKVSEAFKDKKKAFHPDEVTTQTATKKERGGPAGI